MFLGVFREAGFSPEASLYALRSLQGFTLGYSLSELRGFVLGGPRGAPILDELSPRELRRFPNIAEIAPGVGRMDPDDAFETGLALVLGGYGRGSIALKGADARNSQALPLDRGPVVEPAATRLRRSASGLA